MRNRFPLLYGGSSHEEEAALDLSLPLSYGPPPPPSTDAPLYASSILSSSHLPAPIPPAPSAYGTPSGCVSCPLPAAAASNPAPSFGSYGLASENEEQLELYRGPQLSLTPPAKFRGKGGKGIVGSATTPSLETIPATFEEAETPAPYKPSASRLIPRIVKAPFSRARKLIKSLSWRNRRQKKQSSKRRSEGKRRLLSKYYYIG